MSASPPEALPSLPSGLEGALATLWNHYPPKTTAKPKATFAVAIKMHRSQQPLL